MFAATLAIVAVAAAIIGMVRDISSLGLIAAIIAAILAAAVVWLQSQNTELTRRLGTASARRSTDQTDDAPTSDEPNADDVARRISGETESSASPPAGAAAAAAGGIIRTPAGDLEGLDLGDTSDLADVETGLLGERYFVVTLEARVSAARRHLRPLALVLIDAVTEVSQDASPIDANLAADVIRETLRDADTLCRMQSGRFAILLEDTPENGAIWTVERIRRRLSEQLEDATVWAGIACYPANGFDGPEVLNQALIALEQAREWRQDRTEIADT